MLKAAKSGDERVVEASVASSSPQIEPIRANPTKVSPRISKII
jgi:hypothetical protein